MRIQSISYKDGAIMNGSIAKCISTPSGREFVLTTDSNLKEDIMFLSDDFPIAMFIQNFQHAAIDYIPLHMHDELQITWTFEGELDYSINNDNFKLSKDKILILNRNQLHSSKTINNDAKTLCLQFGLDFFHPPILKKYILPFIDNKCFSYHLLALTPHRVKYLEKFLNWHNDSIGYFSAINFLLQTFEEVLDEFQGNEHEQETEEINTFNTLISFIHDNYSAQITLAEIAKHALINKNRCTSLFKKYTKMSPVKYLNTYRLYIAKNMIIHSDKPISEISSDVGYNQLSFFIEKFRSSYGFPPLKYRNKFGQKSN